MITDLMLQTVSTLIHWVLSVRPVWSFALPSGVQTVIATALAYDAVLPIHEMVEVISTLALLTIGTTFFAWSLKLVDLIAAIIP